MCEISRNSIQKEEGINVLFKLKKKKKRHSKPEAKLSSKLRFQKVRTEMERMHGNMQVW